MELIAFLLKACVFHSKVLIMLFFPSLLLVVLALPHLQTLMPTSVWHAPTSGFLAGPAFAFLLVNCVIVTIVARSKLENEKRGHEEEWNCKGETIGEVDGDEDLVAGNVKGQMEKGKVETEEQVNGEGDENGILIGDIVAGEIGSQCSDTPVKKGYDNPKNITENVLIRRSWSFNARFEYKIKHEHVKVDLINRKPVGRARLASTRNPKVTLVPHKALSTNYLKEKQLLRGSLISVNGSKGPHHERPALATSFDSNVHEKCMPEALGCDGDFIEHQQPQALSTAAAATATQHPSLDEVWAAIMSSNKTHDRMQPCMPGQSRHKEHTAKNINRSQPAATQLAAAAAPAPPAAAAEAAHCQPGEGKVVTIPVGLLSKAAYRAAPAEQKHVEKGNVDQENDRELEEVNRRAEQFIARFNHQMRLQREESLQRQKRRRRACNYGRMPFSHPPVRGLLVG